MKNKKNKKYYLSYKAAQEMLIDQLIGILQNGVGSYMFEKDKDELYIHKEDHGKRYGLDIYIKSPNFTDEDYYDEDDRMLLHLHPEDILYAILNYKEESRNMIHNYDMYKEKEDKVKYERMIKYGKL